MAHPKRRQSKTRTAKRRTHDKAVAPTLAICPNCGDGMYITLYVVHVVTIEVSLQLKRKLPYNYGQFD